MLAIPSGRAEHFEGVGTIMATRRLLEYGWDKDTPPLLRARRILFRMLAEDNDPFTVVVTSNDLGQSQFGVTYNAAFKDFVITLDVSTTNFPPGDAEMGTYLQTNTSARLVGSTPHTLHILAEIIDHTGNDATSPLSQITVPGTDPLILNTQFARSGVNLGSSTVTFRTTLNGIDYGSTGLGTTGTNGGAPGNNQNVANPGGLVTMSNQTDLKFTAAGTAGTTATSTLLASPEPSTIAMTFAGLPMLGILAWRRRKAQA